MPRSPVANIAGKRYALAFIAVAACVTAVLAPAQADAFASGSPAISATVASIQRDWSYVPEYAAAPALDAGRLTDSSGHAVSGATVIVFPVLLNTRPNQALPAIARATTNAAGRFTIHLPRAKRALLHGLRPNGGVGNIHIIAFYPGAIANWFAPVQENGGDIAISNMVLQRLPAQAASAPAAVSPLASPDGCLVDSSTEKPNIKMIVGYKSNTNAKDIRYSAFTYTAEADETTGVGVSVTDASVGFSVQGTSSQTSGLTINYPTIKGKSSNYFEAWTTWDRQKLTCLFGRQKPYNEWLFVFDSVNAGAGTPAAPVVKATHCTRAAGGSTYTYYSTTQATWTRGASTSGIIGINLSSQDGWSRNAQLTYALKANGQICGTQNVPNGHNPSAGWLQTH
jgi:hypothetical protein